eukprot:CAMPEP_0198545608 /NCGR_PEP_ID=MMETSP1462-20131121/64642_1 /TAXON_ID=1333877 /ORGANISM="Brandtodinium nutriculum, Strain RCC3387" /LENGTH=48 /DNA_ID= /DNA_START= /DNA_END= /DNA_ORIENTATION=
MACVLIDSDIRLSIRNTFLHAAAAGQPDADEDSVSRQPGVLRAVTAPA